MEASTNSVKWRRPRKLKGLGDLIALAAHPVAAALDAAFGTEWVDCRTCAGRRETLNRHFPFATASAEPPPDARAAPAE